MIHTGTAFWGLPLVSFLFSFAFDPLSCLLESIDYLLSPMVYTNITGVNGLSLSRD